MPTYELRCNSCGELTETFIPRLIRAEDRVCASCGSTDVRQGVGGGTLLGSAARHADESFSCGGKTGFS